MTGLMGKVKDALSSNSHSSSTQPEGTHGHHSTRTANAADPRIDSDRDHRAAPSAHDGSYTSTSNYTYGSGTTGDNRGLDGPATKTDGPHKSNLMNKADPRVDSDRDHSRNMGANPSGTATTGAHNTTGTSGLHTTTGTTGTSGLHSSTGVSGSTNAGPHNSNLMNKADPRVDSDRDHSRNMGANPSGTATTGTYGSTGTTGLHSSTGVSGSTNAGPHNSNLMNKADPRVDSDRDHSRNMGANPSGTATTGTYGTTGLSGTHGTHGTHGTTGLGSTGSTNAGPHNSNMMNKADPRVDSDLDNRGTTGTMGGKSNVGGFSSGTHTGTTGTHGAHGTHGTTGLTGSSTTATGPAPNTAGPHKSDMMNKVDPRVDSDLDGSKTYGGDKTYTRSTSGNTYANKDPTDAAQVPPSVLQKHIGPPVVEHDDHHHKRADRHSISHQEEHRGL